MGTTSRKISGAGRPMPFAQAFTNRQEDVDGARNRMSDIGKMVERLISAGCMPKVAAEVVSEAFLAGVSAAPSRDATAEKRRAWDREYRKKRNAKSGGSGGSRVETDPLHALWTEGIGLLRQLGVAEKPARSNVGLWLKSHQPQLVLDRIREAARQRIGNPVPWIMMSFSEKSNGRSKPKSGAELAFDLAAEARERERAVGLFRPDDLVRGD